MDDRSVSVARANAIRLMGVGRPAHAQSSNAERSTEEYRERQNRNITNNSQIGPPNGDLEEQQFEQLHRSVSLGSNAFRAVRASALQTVYKRPMRLKALGLVREGERAQSRTSTNAETAEG